MAKTACAVLVGVASLSLAHARPVSYEGGWTVNEETNRQTTSALVHYTVNPSLSIGYRAEWDRREDFVFNGAQATYLAKRWFGENYQGNIYLFGGLGAASPVGETQGDTTFAAMTGVMGDWETRRLFLSYRARLFEAGELDATFAQAARIGVAPYVANTGALHAWVMVEIDHRPDNPDPVGVTPLLRLFKGRTMLEAGWSVTDNQPLVNFIYRF